MMPTPLGSKTWQYYFEENFFHAKSNLYLRVAEFSRQFQLFQEDVFCTIFDIFTTFCPLGSCSFGSFLSIFGPEEILSGEKQFVFNGCSISKAFPTLIKDPCLQNK